MIFQMSLRTKKIALALVLLICGGVIGWFSHNLPFVRQSRIFKGSVLRDDNSGYRFINPMLACDVGSEEAFPEFKPVKNALSALIAQSIKSNAASGVSAYVRSMKTGRWFQINGDASYAPASLLKVFIMIAYYKEAENNPAILEKQIRFKAVAGSTGGDNPGEAIPHLTDGKNYTVSQLIDEMIIYSDNDALSALVDHFDAETLEDFKGIFSDLNIASPLTQDESKLNFISVSGYSMIFRILFGATYLSGPTSEKALALLARAHYAGGIVAGVPAGMPIAHKFGLRSIPAAPGNTGTAEFHDCGIVYYPNHPYLLCVMTRGSDFVSLQQVIQDISRTTYQQLDKFFSALPSRPTSSATAAGVK